MFFAGEGGGLSPHLTQAYLLSAFGASDKAEFNVLLHLNIEVHLMSCSFIILEAGCLFGVLAYIFLRNFLLCESFLLELNILTGVDTEYSLERLVPKLELQYFGYLM